MSIKYFKKNLWKNKKNIVFIRVYHDTRTLTLIQLGIKVKSRFLNETDELTDIILEPLCVQFSHNEYNIIFFVSLSCFRDIFDNY